MSAQGEESAAALSRIDIVVTGPDVTDAHLEGARSAAGLSEPLRLGRGGALFPEAGSSALEAARAALSDAPVDVNAVQGGARRRMLLISDMDSTIIQCECIDEIADMLGVKPQVAAITERAMRGEIPFEAALRERVSLLKGLPVGRLEEVYAERVRLSQGARTLARTMAGWGAKTLLVSGGFTYFSERVAAAAGFAEHRANTLLTEGDTLSGRVGEPILGRDAKRVALEETLARADLTLEDAAAIGDGANDLAMIEAAGLGVAYRAKPAVSALADARLEVSDLSALLYLQGVSEAAFIAD